MDHLHFDFALFDELFSDRHRLISFLLNSPKAHLNASPNAFMCFRKVLHYLLVIKGVRIPSESSFSKQAGIIYQPYKVFWAAVKEEVRSEYDRRGWGETHEAEKAKKKAEKAREAAEKAAEKAEAAAKTSGRSIFEPAYTSPEPKLKRSGGGTLNTKTRKGDARYTPYAVSSSAIRSFSSSASRTRALVSGLLEERDCGMPTAAFASVGTTSSSAPSHMDWPSVVSASSLDGERARGRSSNSVPDYNTPLPLAPAPRSHGMLSETTTANYPWGAPFPPTTAPEQIHVHEYAPLNQHFPQYQHQPQYQYEHLGAELWNGNEGSQVWPSHNTYQPGIDQAVQPPLLASQPYAPRLPDTFLSHPSPTAEIPLGRIYDYRPADQEDQSLFPSSSAGAHALNSISALLSSPHTQPTLMQHLQEQSSSFLPESALLDVLCLPDNLLAVPEDVQAQKEESLEPTRWC
ncbi:hypothetical protein BD309DRAFT_327882 [Dichomitus squalens]|nr:hypothetical protein BD309DRAFT_327882 [Dichomitus squalens]